MKVKGRNHVYRYVPNYLNNRQLPAEKKAEQIVVLLKIISAQDDDAYHREVMHNTRIYSVEKAQELNEARLNKLIKEKFIGIEGLEIEGHDGPLDFDTFYSEAPPELVRQIITVMRSSEELSTGEQKNFWPESDGL